MSQSKICGPKQSREHQDRIWQLALAICAEADGAEMLNKSDRSRFAKYARAAYKAGARTPQDIRIAAEGYRRRYRGAPVTAAGLGQRWGDYMDAARACGLVKPAVANERAALLERVRRLGVSEYSERFERLFPASGRSPYEPESWSEVEMRAVVLK